MERYFIKVVGRVQGVGFRYNTLFVAKTFGVTGWVKNCNDGSVDIEVQGEENSVQKFISKIKQGGNPVVKVTDTKVVKIECIEGERTFKVNY